MSLPFWNKDILQPIGQRREFVYNGGQRKDAMRLDIPTLVSSLTLEEKAGLCSGQDEWFTKAVSRLGLPAVMVSDGPHGLRTQKEKVNGRYQGSVQAICFPTGCALASSFDRELLGHVGDDLGSEAAAEGVHTLLGPAINIKRSPLCGRNFEYYSEDSYLAGQLAASFVKGVQKHGVGTSVKHFAANNQETRRMSISDVVDERTLREIYLSAFEQVVKDAKPWTLMCSYNRINGTYSCENEWLLSQVLRKEWGFDGIVMSDWGAMDDRCKSLEAGCELEMPASHGANDAKIVQAVKEGKLPLSVLDEAVRRLLVWIGKGLEKESVSYDKDEHHLDAREAAGSCAVLLRNERHALPLDSGRGVLFVGPFAGSPRYQGGGSSHINSYLVGGALDVCPEQVQYLPGMQDSSEKRSAERLRKAVEAARKAKAVVIFAGLTDKTESEGYDRTSLKLPACQDELIERISEVQKRTIVVLYNGSPVMMPWKDKVAAIVEMYLGGEAVGEATVDVLFGITNPSGKLAETFPLRLEDTPSFLSFPGGKDEVTYQEGVFVGYRWYDARKLDVLFPFGHGLSYTTFAYSPLAVHAEGTDVEVSLSVKNTGSREGAEVVQLYVAPPLSPEIRPVKELKGFAKVFLKPGETKDVAFRLDRRSFAYWADGWRVEQGSYGILVGSSSRDIRSEASVELAGDGSGLLRLTDSTTVKDVLDRSEDYPAFANMMGQVLQSVEKDSMSYALMMGCPLHSLASFLPVRYEDILRMLGR